MTADPIQTLAAERAWVEVDRDAIAHNIGALQSGLKPGTDLMAIVKADGYGHGAVRVAAIAQASGVRYFGVATVLEGIELRQAGIDQSILVMGAVQSPPQIEAIAHWTLEPTLCTLEQAQQFSKILRYSLPVHLKIDTGMSRLGQTWQTGAPFIQQVQALPHLNVASIYSHFATADDPDPSFMKEQQRRFDAVISQAYPADAPRPALHLANSAGTLWGQDLHYSRVRVGLSLYGIYPGSQFQSALTLRPAMQVRARITQLKNLDKGVGVSYGHRLITAAPCRVAVVGIGYADGIPRNLSNQMQVLVQGQRVPQLGTITMDQIVIDVSSIPTVAVGEVVTLLGQDGNAAILADEWAKLLDTIPYEIVCGFQQRLPRLSIG